MNPYCTPSMPFLNPVFFSNGFILATLNKNVKHFFSLPDMLTLPDTPAQPAQTILISFTLLPARPDQHLVYGPEVPVQVRADQNNIHTEIHPQQYDNNDGKAAVNTVGITVIHINTESIYS